MSGSIGGRGILIGYKVVRITCTDQLLIIKTVESDHQTVKQHHETVVSHVLSLS